MVERIVGGEGQVGLRGERGSGFLGEVDDANGFSLYDATGGGGVLPGDDLKEGRFAHPVWPDERNTLARVNGEANALEYGVDII